MLPGKKYKPEDILWIAWRRKWFIVVPFVIVALGTIVVSRTLPDRYRSEALLLVRAQKVPDSYVRSTVTIRLEDRLQTLQQIILSRQQLEPIITEFALYSAERRSLPMQDVIERMKSRDIQLQVVKGDAFKVAFTYGDRATAQKVAARLSSLFKDMSTTDRAAVASETRGFLEKQLGKADEDLKTQEKALTEYKLQHANELPTERQSNLQVLQNLQMQVQALVDSIGRDRDQRLLLERALADLNAESQSTANPSGAVDLTSPTVPTAVRLEAARAARRNLRLTYKEGHPDIKKLDDVIAELQKKVDAEALEAPLSPTVSVSPEEAARRKRAGELQAQAAALDLQIKQKEASEKSLRERINVYEAWTGATPIREAQLIELTRDYETVQQTYRSLKAKLEDAKVAEAMENGQIGERFDILDDARVPERPVSPNRPMINLLGALAGLGFGAGLVAFLEYRDRSMRTDDDVTLCLSLPVLALVPVMTTASERRHVRRLRWASAVGGLVFLAVAAASAFALSWSWLKTLIAR